MRIARESAARRRPGFTLLEMVIALTISLIVFSAALPLLQLQARSVASHAKHADASFTAQYGVNAIDRELRMAGAGVADAQAMLVYAAPRAITFNANLVTNDADPTAVYADSDAVAASSIGLLKSRAVRLPLSAIPYPDTNYVLAAGVPSMAETVSYWVSPDSTGTRADQQILWRRVNDQPPQPLAKGIVVAPGEPVFRYYRQDSTGKQIEIPASRLPLHHSAPLHSVLTGVKPDTGSSALTDSIRSVSVRLVGLYRNTRTGVDGLDTSEVRIRVMNAGLNRVAACGVAPRFAALLKLTPNAPGAEPSVQLDWDASVDELTGEQDVERYLVLRRRPAAPDFAEPIAVVPGGAATHTFVDSGMDRGAWVYGVATQDCTPSTSAVITAQVNVP